MSSSSLSLSSPSASTPSSSSSSSSTVVNNSKNPRCNYMVVTETTIQQRRTEYECEPYFVNLETLPPGQLDHLRQTGLIGGGGGSGTDNNNNNNNNNTDDGNENDLRICLLTSKHVKYLSQVFELNSSLSASYTSLDASRPWMIYWCLQGLDVMGQLPNKDDVLCRIVSTLRACWSTCTVTLSKSEYLSTFPKQQQSTTTMTGGGFGGNVGQIPHCATTYAACMALCIVAGQDNNNCESKQLAFSFLKQIRYPLYAWFLSLLQSDYSFRMHHDGEIDVRAAYTIFACCKLLQLPMSIVKLSCPWIASCQTFEGGLGSETKFCEAHGGYTYCGVAALCIANQFALLSQSNLLGWLCRRQMSFEGGFQGRTNKLVDGCYSFWQGGALTIASAYYNKNNNKTNQQDVDNYDPWLENNNDNDSNNNNNDNNTALSLYDEPMLQRYILLCAQDVHGGLRDKPSKPRDFYHSCYNLSGLSASKLNTTGNDNNYGRANVHAIHPLYNVRIDRVKIMLQYQWE